MSADFIVPNVYICTTVSRATMLEIYIPDTYECLFVGSKGFH